jgi:SPP1 family predicted phage head-tail adaptor
MARLIRASAGLLSDFVTLLQPTTVDDGQGGQTVTWTEVSGASRVHAQIVPLSGREALLAGGAGVQSVVTHRITIYDRDDVTAQWRVQGDDATYEITGLRKDDVWMELDVVEVPV